MPVVNFQPAEQRRETLEIEIPDWSAFDHHLGAGTPFILWRVGYQSLLHHWLDHAINAEVSYLRIYCPGKPHLVRQAMEEATLWPIDWELIPGNPKPGGRTPVTVLGLPPAVGESLPDRPDDDSNAVQFRSQWDLLEYWFSLERECFSRLRFEGKTEDLELWIGRFSHVDPSAKRHFPLWIGDNVYIGPGAEVGPYASIGHNSVIEGHSEVIHSKVGDDTFLGAHTHLEAAYLDGNRLISRKHRTAVTMNDAFVATAIKKVHRRRKPGKLERVAAIGYWLALRGKQLRRRLAFWQKRKPDFWEPRVAQLIDVALGKRLLFGILPRSEAALAAHETEWREILEAETPGVFSYADTLGCHHAEEGMEPIHAVYQATQSRSSMERTCREFLHDLISRSSLSETVETQAVASPTSES